MAKTWVWVAVVLSVMLLVSINSVVAEEEQPTTTVGQRIDSALTSVTNAFNEHGGKDAVETVSSTAKSVYGWFGDKAKYVYHSLNLCFYCYVRLIEMSKSVLLYRTSHFLSRVTSHHNKLINICLLC